MNIWALCKCGAGQICPFCKILVILGIVILGGIVGYFIRKKKNTTKK